MSENRKKSLTDFEFEALVRANISRMIIVANRILNDESLAEDAVQSAFAKVHERYETFEKRSTLATWIHRITVNEALTILRRNKRLREESIDEFLPEFDQSNCRVESDFEAPKSPESEMEEQQLRDVVANKINQLPTKYRIVLVLRDIEEMTTEEVASALEISIPNVKTRLHRARSALKRLLEPFLDGDSL